MSRTTIRFDEPIQPGLVTAIIPTYNRAASVKRAVESALRQTYAPIEVIVIDDGSTDDTRDVLATFGDHVRAIHQPNAGVPAARNTGLTRARGEFVAFLDSDDEWLDWKIDAEVAALSAHPSAGLVWTDMRAVDPSGNVIHDRYLRRMYAAYADVSLDEILPHVGTLGDVRSSAPRELAESAMRMGDLSSYILIGNLLHTPTVLHRRTWIEQVGGFDPEWGNGGEDYEYYTRLCTAGPVILIDAPSIRYRIGSADQLTADDRMLHMAHRDLATLHARLREAKRGRTLPRGMLRRRLARSHGWVGSAEFDAGHRFAAARHLASSLATFPQLDRRIVLLACCALPSGVIHGLRSIKRRIT